MKRDVTLSFKFIKILSITLNLKIKDCYYTFILIFKFISIYLLHVLFVLKLRAFSKTEKVSPKKLKEIFFLYIV